MGVVGVTTNATPLHVTVLIALINGKGFTVITTVKLLPTQPLLVGCKVYVTDNEPFVVFVNVPTIVETEPVNNVLVTPDADPTALTRLYIVPTGTTPFDAPGTRLIEPPVHTTWVIPEMIARGLSVTTTLNCAPTQLPDVGVTRYVAVRTSFTVFNNVPLIVNWPVADAPPVKPLPNGELHAYVVPDGTTFVADGVTAKATLPQVTAVNATICAFGFTPTFNVNVAPTQLPDGEVGTTRYVAVCITFEEFCNVPVIVLPLPPTPPLKPDVYVCIDQLYVVFAGTVPFVPCTGVAWKTTPSQVITVMFVTEGVAFTVTTTLNCAPTQLPDVGVTRYVAVRTSFTVFNNVPLIVSWPVADAPPVKPLPVGALQV